jgi:hypothetical protein|eukprot:SAG25_NODE_31_length_20541_cov_59.033069_3_plen_140_part_00
MIAALHATSNSATIGTLQEKLGAAEAAKEVEAAKAAAAAEEKKTAAAAEKEKQAANVVDQLCERIATSGPEALKAVPSSVIIPCMHHPNNLLYLSSVRVTLDFERKSWAMSGLVVSATELTPPPCFCFLSGGPLRSAAG